MGRMTAQPSPAPHVVTVPRSRFNWPEGYFVALQGLRVAYEWEGVDLYGTLVEAIETPDEITLTLVDPRVED